MTIARRPPAALAALAVWLAMPSPLAAHRLDEYLQASRLLVDADRVTIELDLTPGASIASAVVASADGDRDGAVSAREQDAYARAIVASLALSIDGTPAAVRLREAHFPPIDAFGEGAGTIRVRADAMMPPAAPGRHTLRYANAHRPDASVYLVNALVPADPRVQIASQHRDTAQHTLMIDYDVAPSPWARGWWIVAGFAVAGVLMAGRRRLSAGCIY